MKFVVITFIVSSFLLAGCGSSSDTLNAAKSSVADSPQPLPDFSEDKIVETYRAFDLVLRGQGFFVVKSPLGDNYFTRAGSFIKDSLGTGVLTTRDGYYLQGYAIDDDGKVSDTLSNVQVTTLGHNSKARATTTLSYSLNLNAGESLAHGAFDSSSFTNAEATSQWNLSQTAYDSSGSPYEVRTFFRKISANTWSYHVLTNTFKQNGIHRTVISNLFAGISGITSTQTEVLEEGELVFSSMGTLVTVNVTHSSPALHCDFGQAIASLNRVTQFGGNFSVNSLAQDGSTVGTLSSLNIQKDGRILAYFSNGVERDVYKIPVAIFANERGLKLVATTKEIYSETQASGKASIGEARSAGRAWIKSFALEEKYFIPNLPDFSQGAFKSSTRLTDLAIEGNGFFIVRDPSIKEVYYTRQGSFEQNGNGKLILAGGGYSLQGYAIDEMGKLSTSLSDIEFRNTSSHPLATTMLHYSMNLDASAAMPTSGGFDGASFEKANATSNESVSMTIYDSLGNSRNVITYFRKEAPNVWSYHVLTDGMNLANYGGGSGTVVLAEGLMSFSTSGRLDIVTPHIYNYSNIDTDGVLVAGEVINQSLAGDASKIRWADGAAPVTLLFYDFGQFLGSKFVTTQYSGSSSVTQLEQDGRAVGALAQIEIISNGRISATFNNGAKRDVYEIPLASFINAEGLKRAEDDKNLFLPTVASGKPAIGAASTFDRGEIRSYALEQK